MSRQIHGKTPVVAVFNGRSGPVRRVDYLRGSTRDDTQRLVTAQAYDLLGRIVDQWDPRFHGTQTVSLHSLYSLSGTPLRTENVDAGVRCELPGLAGERLHRWDARGSEQQTEYDSQLRPTLIRERGQDQAWATVGRLRYGSPSTENALHNRCGRRIEHYDTAGLTTVDDYSMAGLPLDQGQRFLDTLEIPDWPDDEAQRERLLEPARYDTRWHYDALGDALGLTDAKGHSRRIELDVAGQPKRVHLQWAGSPTAELVTHEFQYSAAGQLQACTAGNGIKTRLAYDPANGRLTELKAMNGSDALQHLTYLYDPMGHVTSIADHTHVVRYHANQRSEDIRTFVYDSLYRLEGATGLEIPGAGTQPGLPGLVPPSDLSLRTPYTQHYEYDQGGNLEKLVHNSAHPGQGHTLRLTLDPSSNRCLQWHKGEAAPGDDLDFDAGGNQLSLPASGQHLTWNWRNQLRKVTQVQRHDGEDDAEHYSYNGQGIRMRKRQIALAASVSHVRDVRYLPGLEIRTLDDSEELHVCTLQGPASNVRGLYWAKGRPSEIEQGQLRYSLEDHLGSLVMELDQDARLISLEGYYPFGGTAWWAADSQVQARYKTVRYSGKERDASGLYYYGFRYYALWMMRWINPDPAGPVDGLNLYAMVGNNPIGLVDAFGLGKEKFYQAFSQETERMLTGAGKNPLPPQKGKPHEVKQAREEFYREFPYARFTTATKNKLTAHAGVLFDNGDPSASIMITNVYNISPPKKIEDVPGITVHKPRHPTVREPNLIMSGILAVDLSEFATHLGERYIEAVRDPDIKIHRGGSVTPVGISGIEYEASLPDMVRELVIPHIEQSDMLTPQSAGIPGYHAEVIQGNLIRLFPNVKENLQFVTLATQKLQGANVVEDFPACFNCTNILVDSDDGAPGFNIITGRTPTSHDEWKRMVKTYPD
ncbi:RHS repeat domain-containing protein [Pseudomonas thivervalensis]|uniref:RHS repeat domain-containing protein n=1 Tax=Pseudomonas thivervalensis TaxID=86265 RepID=UPI003CE6F488